MDDFFDKVAAERQYQLNKWGNTDIYNNEYNWAAYIGAYTNRSLIGTPGDSAARKDAFRADMIKVAALALAAYQNT